MLGDIDRNKLTYSEKFELTLCKADKKIELSLLEEAYNINLTRKFKETDELEFDIPFYITCQHRQVKNPNWDLIKGWYKIKVNDEQYFVIDKVTNIGKDKKKKKHIHCYSEEYVLAKKYVYIDKVTTLQLCSDKVETGDGILSELLPQYVTGWKVGKIEHKAEYEDEALNQYHKKYRVFEGTKKTWLDFLLTDVQSAFKCRLYFDTINNVIDVYNDKDTEEDKKKRNKGLLICDENYLKDIQQVEKHSEIITRIYPYGKDNLNIAAYNPTGELYIENFDYYKNEKYMSKELIQHLNQYENTVKEKTEVYYGILKQINDYNVDREREMGLWHDVETNLYIAQLDLDVKIKQLEALYGMIFKKGEFINLDDTKTRTDEQKKEVAKFQEEIKDLQKKVKKLGTDSVACQIYVETIDKQLLPEEFEKIKQLAESLKKTNFFTSDEIKQLEDLTLEKNWINKNYFDVRELYHAAVYALNQINTPPIEYTTDMVNFLDVIECQHDWDKLVLGDYINLYHSDLNIDIYVKLIKISYSSDKKKLNLTFSNKDDCKDEEKFISDMMSKINGNDNVIQIFKNNWDKASDGYDLVTKMRNSALNAAKNKILSINPHQEIRIDGHGIWMIDGDHRDRQLRLVSDLLVMTTDNFDTVRLAISPEGIFAENIIGELVAGNRLIITNRDDEGNHSFMVTGSHMSAYNMDLSLESKNHMNRIYLNPERGFAIQRKENGWKDTMWCDMEGHVHAESFIVINTNSRLDDKGLTIENGAIWIKNKDGDIVFHADENGETDAFGRFRVFRYDLHKNKITLADLYKDERKGGKLRLNDWDGNINAFLGSAPSHDYVGGFLKLYNGDEKKERIEIGVHSKNDMGVMKIKNNESKRIVELTGNDSGGTLKLNNKLEKTKVFISSQDADLDQGIIKLYGEDDEVKIAIKAKSFTDNMTKQGVTGDRKTGGLIEFSSYDNSTHYFITANNENNFGMYSEKGDAFEINQNANRCTMFHNSGRHVKVSNTDVVLGYQIIAGEGTDYHNKAITINGSHIVISYDANNYITIGADGIKMYGTSINLN